MNKYLLQYEMIHDLLVRATRDMLNNGFICMKVFKGTENILYFYRDAKGDEQYSRKLAWTSCNIDDYFIDNFYAFLTDYTADLPVIKVARLQKKANGVRLRFDEDYSKQDALDSMRKLAAKASFLAEASADASTPAKPLGITDSSYVATEKKGNKMGDFSLANLKDALVNKITHLDRKTVMILSIIALLLLIAGKYNTIKDILSGIKNKVKNSDNFKAMVTDGTNAINSLKKIVGVKSKGDADAEV